MLRRIIGLVLAVVLAAVGTLVLVAYVRGAEERALAGEQTVDVLVVREDVPRGTPAESLGRMVETEKVPAKVQAVGSVDNLDDLAGTVTAVDLVPGEQVVTQRFVAPEDLAGTGVEVPEGLLQVTVSLAAERTLGGRLTPGDTVAVLASFTSGVASTEEGPDTTGVESTHIVLHKVLVSQVQGAVQRTAGVPGADEDQTQTPAGNLLVTLALDAGSVERVVFAAEHGSLWLSLEPPTADETGTRIQTKGTIYR